MLKKCGKLLTDLNYFILFLASLFWVFGNFGLSFVWSFIFNACGLGKSRLGILLLLSIPVPFVDFDAPKLYPLGDCANLSSAPIWVSLELILQYSALLQSHAHAMSYFSRQGSRSGWSWLTHHLLRDSIIWTVNWGGWIKILIPTLLFVVWGILCQCCFQSYSNIFLIAQVSLDKGRWRSGSLFACRIEGLRLSLVQLLSCCRRHSRQIKTCVALGS